MLKKMSLKIDLSFTKKIDKNLFEKTIFYGIKSLFRKIFLSCSF